MVMILEGNRKEYLKFWQVTLSRVFSVNNIVNDVKYLLSFLGSQIVYSRSNISPVCSNISPVCSVEYFTVETYSFALNQLLQLTLSWKSDWETQRMIQTRQVEEWKYIILHLAGVLCMMTLGLTLTVALSVVNWVSQEETNQKSDFTMVKELVQYCLAMLNALVKKSIYGIAIPVTAGNLEPLTMGMMQALTVTDI